MVDFDTIERLMQLARHSGFSRFEYKSEAFSVKFETPVAVAPSYVTPFSLAHGLMPPGGATPRSDGAAPKVAASTPSSASGEDKAYKSIRSPLIGTFYSRPSPEDPPFVQVGQRVKKGDTLGIVEAMKMMNPIEADVAGVVMEILVNNEDPIEYDQELFRIE